MSNDEKTVKATFDIIDVNKDGLITFDELQNFCVQLWCDMQKNKPEPAPPAKPVVVAKKPEVKPVANEKPKPAAAKPTDRLMQAMKGSTRIDDVTKQIEAKRKEVEKMKAELAAMQKQM